MRTRRNNNNTIQYESKKKEENTWTKKSFQLLSAHFERKIEYSFATTVSTNSHKNKWNCIECDPFSSTHTYSVHVRTVLTEQLNTYSLQDHTRNVSNALVSVFMQSRWCIKSIKNDIFFLLLRRLKPLKVRHSHFSEAIEKSIAAYHRWRLLLLVMLMHESSIDSLANIFAPSLDQWRSDLWCAELFIAQVSIGVAKSEHLYFIWDTFV